MVHRILGAIFSHVAAITTQAINLFAPCVSMQRLCPSPSWRGLPLQQPLLGQVLTTSLWWWPLPGPPPQPLLRPLPAHHQVVGCLQAV